MVQETTQTTQTQLYCFETVLCFIGEPGEGREYPDFPVTYRPRWVDPFPHTSHINVSFTPGPTRACHYDSLH